MSLIEWREEFATGISGVDYEHETLITMLNTFYEEMQGNADKDVLITMLNDIYGAIYSHFVLEEKQMLRYRYDQYEAHRADHCRLLDEIWDITAGLEELDKFDDAQFKKKLSDWFSVHFRTHDARLHRLEVARNEHAGQKGFGRRLQHFSQKIFGRK